MKNFVFMTLMFSLCVLPAQAKDKAGHRTIASTEIEATLQEVANDTVIKLFKRDGDSTVVKCKKATVKKYSVDRVCEVTLSNGAAVGSAVYQVSSTVRQNGEAARIDIQLIDSN